MKATQVATILLLGLALWSAHLAGAGYVLGKTNKKTYRWARAKTLFALLLAVMVCVMNW